MRKALAACLVFLTVCVGVVPASATAAPTGPSDPGASNPGPALLPTAPASGTAPSDVAAPTDAALDAASADVAPDATRQETPTNDTVGYWNGYWHDDSIDVDQSDGLSDAEMEAYVSRAMARVEYVRNESFREGVPVTVMTREEYRETAQNHSEANQSYGNWNNQVWKALFIVGEDRDVQEELGATLGTAVAGFYAPERGEIVVITDDADEPTVDNATLVHELVHALQDQRYDLGDSTYRGATQDEDLAIDGVVEGEANYVESRYSDRCGEEWDCVDSPGGGDGESEVGGGDQPNLGILLTLFQPYSDGPAYVHHNYERDGWDAVDERFADPPSSTEQTIHVTDEEPTPIDYEDRARGGWETYPNLGDGGADTVGEASLFAMGYYVDRNRGLPEFDWQSVADEDDEHGQFNYSSSRTDGWDNDVLYPYRNDEGGETEHGYVWVLEWDTPDDAAEFYEFYLNVLDAHDAERRDDGTYRIDGESFGGAYLVNHSDARVTVVHAPERADLDDLRPGLEPSSPPGEQETPTATPTADGNGDETTEPPTEETPGGADPTEETPTETDTPGFGVVVAVVAAIVAAAVAARRSDRKR